MNRSAAILGSVGLIAASAVAWAWPNAAAQEPSEYLCDDSGQCVISVKPGEGFTHVARRVGPGRTDTQLNPFRLMLQRRNVVTGNSLDVDELLHFLEPDLGLIPGGTPSTTTTTTSPATTAPPTSSTSTTAPSTSSTQPSTTSTSAPTTSTAPTSTTTSVPSPTSTSTTTTVPSGGGFSDDFSSGLDGWVWAHRTYDLNGGSNPASVADTVGGQARIVNHDQNYGDATLRSQVQYDLRGGGTLSVEVEDDGTSVLAGTAYIFLSPTAVDALPQHFFEFDPGYAPYPTGGTALALVDDCRFTSIPPVAVVYNPAAPNGRTRHSGNCAIAGSGRRFVEVSTNRIVVRNAARTILLTYNVPVPPVGFLSLGVHNHASVKYEGQAAVTGLFDNVSYPTGGPPSPTTTTTAPATTTSSSPTPPPATSTSTSSSTSTTTSTTTPTGGDFTATFDTPASLDAFDFQISTARDEIDPLAPQWMGDHDMSCGNPDTTERLVHGGHISGDPVGETVWHCNAHVMTALDTDSQALLSFSPRRTFSNVQRVCLSLNMNDLGGGKWGQLLVVPASAVTAAGGDLGFRSGLAVQNELIPFNPNPTPDTFSWSFLRGSTHGHVGTSFVFEYWGATDANMPDSAVGRHPICVTDLNNGQLRWEVYRPESGTVQTRTSAGALPNGVVKVIVQDASYDPDKHGGTADITWHFDDLLIDVG